MAAAEAIALVDLEGHAGRSIDERGPERVGPRPVPEERGAALARALGGQIGKARVLGLSAARDDGAERVEQHQAGRGYRGSGQCLEVDLGGESGEPVEVVGAHRLIGRASG